MPHPHPPPREKQHLQHRVVIVLLCGRLLLTSSCALGSQPGACAPNVRCALGVSHGPTGFPARVFAFQGGAGATLHRPVEGSIGMFALQVPARVWGQNQEPRSARSGLRGWQGPEFLSHHLGLPGLRASVGSWSGEPEQGAEPRCSWLNAACLCGAAC